MKKCPFCGAKVVIATPYLTRLSTNGKYVFNHYCNLGSADLDIVVDIYGDSKEEIIQKWNRVYEKQTSESL